MAEFKTSFIPQKPIIQKENQASQSGVNIVLFVSLILFFGTLIVTGGIYLYGAILERQEVSLGASIERAKQAVEPELVSSLVRIDSRIKAVRDILDNHTVVSAFFSLLEQITLSSVSFETFRYVVEPDGKILAQLGGSAKNYASIALQSVLFGENKFIENPVFSNLQLNSIGNVTFSLSANVNKRLVLYKNIISGSQ
ncbi:MAG: hypothetical protein Q8R36_04960 [bacterium]|nr:hypothetical protein [bacterium]